MRPGRYGRNETGQDLTSWTHGFVLVSHDRGLFLAVVVPRIREDRALKKIERLGFAHGSGGCPPSWVYFADRDAVDRVLGLEGRLQRIWFNGSRSQNARLLPGQVSSLERLENLRLLELKNLSVDELLEQRVILADGLREISLWSIPGKKSAAGLALVLSEQTKLKSVEIRSCKSINDTFLEVIAQNRGLTDVLIIGSGITGVGFAHFEGHRDLSLWIEDCPLSSEGMAAVSNLSVIRSLTIHVSSESREALWHLTALPRTCKLELGNSRFFYPSFTRAAAI